MAEQTFKYFAFISYSSHDTAWGKRLQRKLENYRMPSTLCSEHGWERRPLKPVFFAPTDIQPGGLTEELQERLRASRHLIVICSPHSAQSQWVGREIAFFHQLGRTKQIHFFIISGKPHSGRADTECFNPVTDTLGLPEILGANIHEKVYRWPWMNRERAYVQLVSKLLGVEFDAIWQRHRRQLVKRALLWAAGLLAVVAALVGVWQANQPADVEVRLTEASMPCPALPPLREAVVTLTVGGEVKTDTLKSIGDGVVFPNIPHRCLGKEARISVVSRDALSLPAFLPVDTVVSLSPRMVLPLYRNTDTYGLLRFQLWSIEREGTVGGVAVAVDGQQAVSDSQGQVALTVPLERQRPYYIVSSDRPLLGDTLTMPCNEGSLPTLLVE
jgi:hypothetical protein